MYFSAFIYVICLYFRLKEGLKLHEEAEKKEVEKSIHLLQDPEGTALLLLWTLKVIMLFVFVVVVVVAIGKKAREAQKQRQAAPKTMEVETN